MSNVSNTTKHQSELDHFFGELVTKGWTLAKPEESEDKTAKLIKVYPPMTKLDLECIIFGADEDSYYIVGIGEDYLNTISAKISKEIENLTELIEAVIKRTEDGQHQQIEEEVDLFLAKFG